MVNKISTKKNSPKNKTSGVGSSSPLDGFSFEPHKRQFEAITRVILNNEIPQVSGEESLKSLAIVLGIYKSARTNTKIHIKD